MGWKRSVLEDWDEGAIGDSDTSKTVKLPQALISAIHLRLSGTGGAGTPAVDNLLATIKIKTKNGYITDLQSADDLLIARALTGRKPTITNSSGAYTETNHSLYFGRFPKDKAFMLDLTNDNVRMIEVTFGTLIATTAWATTTVKLTVTVDYWQGTPPSEYTGQFFSWKQVEDKATGTLKATFELFNGVRLAGLWIVIGTITTIRQVTIGDKPMSIIFGKTNFRDLVNIHNLEVNPDTAETVVALWKFWEDQGQSFMTDLPVLSMSDPVCTIERGATTSTSRVVQCSVVPN